MDYNISDAFACYTDKGLEELFFSNYKEELFKLNSTIYSQTAVNLQFEDLFSLFHSLWDYCDIGKQTNSCRILFIIWREITPCNKIDKPLVVYWFSGNVITSITTLHT